MTRDLLRVCLGLSASLMVATVALLAWTYAPLFAIGVGTGEYLNWPDLSHLPGGEAKDITFALLAYVAMATLVTGGWPAVQIGLWVWRRSAGRSRRGRDDSTAPS